MVYSPIWVSIAKATDAELVSFVADLQLNVIVRPFIGPAGTEDDEGTFTDEELTGYLRKFARQHLNSVGG